MWNKLLDLWAYWDWFIYRQAPPRMRRKSHPMFAGPQRAKAIFPILGSAGATGIVINLFGAWLPEPVRGGLIFGPIGLILVLGVFGARRGRERRPEFAGWDRRRVQKRDRVAWGFALACILLFIGMVVLAVNRPFPPPAVARDTGTLDPAGPGPWGPDKVQRAMAA